MAIDPLTGLAFALQSQPGVYAVLLGSGVSRTAQIPTGWGITTELIHRLAAAEGATISAGVGFEAAQLAHAHAGAGQHLDGHSPADHGFGGQGPNELREMSVVQEPRQRFVSLGDVAEEDGHPHGGVVPAPLDDAQEERAQLANTPAERRRLLWAGRAGLGPLPQLERLDVAALDVDDAANPGLSVSSPVATGGGPRKGPSGKGNCWCSKPANP